ncbi:MAG: ABC transporter permease [Eubacterium sp.]|nr:ABC transporter permease [Eubacterium sp.]
MGKYIIKRVLLLIPTLIMVCAIVFALMRLVPGNAVEMIVYKYQQSGIEITVEEAQAKLGLDKPAVSQFIEWMWNLVHGDMGTCLFRADKVWDVIAGQVPVSLELGLLTLLISTLVALPLGLFCASHPDTLADNMIRTFSVILSSVPIFWIGTIVLVYPAIWWGFSVPVTYVSITENFAANMKMFLVPAIVSGITQAGMNIRSIRTMTLEVMRQDYVRTAWAKGAGEKRVMFFHAFRNSLIPVITMFGGAIAGLLGGNVVVENMFNIPGIGQQMVTALNNRDYPLAQGCTVFFAVFTMLVNLIVDIAYKWCDPRVKIE